MSEEVSDEVVLDIARGASFDLEARLPDGASAAGLQTTWELTPKAGNLPAKYAETRAALKARTVKGTAGGWRNTLTVPHLAGDAFTVKATVAGQGGAVVKQVDVVTRRRLPLSVYYTSEAALARWNEALPAFRAAFAPVGVEFDVAPKATKTDVEEVVLFRGVDQGPSVLLPSLEPLFTSKRLPPIVPRVGALRVFVTESMSLFQDLHWKDTLTLTTARRLQAGAKIPLLRAPAALAPGGILSATLWVGMDIIDVTRHVKRVDDQTVTLVLPEEVIRKHASGGKTPDENVGDIKIRYEYVQSWFLGWSDGANLLVFVTRNTVGEKLPLTPTEVAKVAAHEVGHCLAQSSSQRWTYPGSKAEANPKYYTGMGGVGPHCATNTKVETKGTWKYRVWDRGRLCVMFHAVGSGNADPAFCPDCALNLKLADLSLTGLRKRWTQ